LPTLASWRFWLWGTHAPSLWAETKPRVYSVTGEWRFHVAESVPVPVNGSELETQVMANPSGVCHASRLCLPLPYLRCQDTFPASSMVSPRALCLCLLPLPELTGTLPPMKNL
jgi:hypothetical protein